MNEERSKGESAWEGVVRPLLLALLGLGLGLGLEELEGPPCCVWLFIMMEGWDGMRWRCWCRVLDYDTEVPQKPEFGLNSFFIHSLVFACLIAFNDDTEQLQLIPSCSCCTEIPRR